MADHIEARLTSAAQALREHEITMQRCVELEHRLDEMDRHLASVRGEHVAERKDVARLEGISLTRVLASLRGARDDRLAEEQAQADAAALRVHDTETRLAAVRRGYGAARARLQALAGAPTAYAAVLDEKERYLRDAGDPRVLQLADERGRLAGELHEIGEALHAAAAAHQSLAVVQEQLGSASGWSTYDTFFGGGLISSAIKHDRLDAAAAAAAQADRYLAVLRTELADVAGVGPTAPQLAVSGLTRFVDVWLDNIFTDWSVRDRIKQAQHNVAHCLGLVQQAHAQLEHRASGNRARLDGIERERHDLLTRDAT